MPINELIFTSDEVVLIAAGSCIAGVALQMFWEWIDICMTHFTPEELKDFTDAIAAHQCEQSAGIFDAEPSEMWMARDVAEAIRKQGE